MLLPGEDVSEYARRMDSTFVALDPRDDAQAQLVALVADDLWKLDRLARIETGLSLARIEELLGQTQLAERAGGLSNAIAALGIAVSAWEDHPYPVNGNPDLARRLQSLSDALDLVACIAGSVSPEKLAACEPLISRLRRVSPGAAVPEGSCAELCHASRMVMGELIDRGDRIEADQGDMRKAVATLAIPDEKELSKLGRYRRMVEEGLHRRLQALECLRRLSTTAAPDAASVNRASEYRMRLRVVS
jgi:hypothetical protein